MGKNIAHAPVNCLLLTRKMKSISGFLFNNDGEPRSTGTKTFQEQIRYAWLMGGFLRVWVSVISGSPFQSPFASPPGEGLSSSMVNVLWGMFNLIVGYVLVLRIGRFDLRQTKHAIVLGLGIFVMALMLARAFGRFHGGIL